MAPAPESLPGIRPEGMTLAQHWQCIRQSAQSRLGSSPYAPLRSVTCDFREGVLTLRGRVSSYYLKQLAQSLVARVAGVEVVVNNIEVTGSIV